MHNYFKYFTGSTIFTILALVGAFFIGQAFGGTTQAGLSALFTALMLGILETSLSFDNAVVNAKILTKMNHFWRTMFLTIGMIIAVFGMRILFPLIIVWVVSDKSFLEVFQLTWQNPKEFQDILIHQHVLISGFGGAFLWMVFTKFFFDHEKDTHWLHWIEKPLSRIGKVDALWVAVTLLITFIFYNVLPHAERDSFLVSAVIGILVYILVEGLGSLMNHQPADETKKKANSAKHLITAGIGSFLYLEVLDASFSFDGVIGAFALTNNLFIIALGLGIGAFFVRSLTIKMVDSNALDSFTYLENGAFWAIGALSLIMYLGAAGVEVPEIVSGSIGLVFIGLSFISSILLNKKNAKVE